MTNTVKYLCFIALLLVSQQVSASEVRGYMSGNKILEWCNKSEGMDGVCLGYISGIADVMSSNAVNGFRACSSSVPLGQLVLVTKKWFGAHPEILHYPADGLIAAAMEEAFPCPAE